MKSKRGLAKDTVADAQLQSPVILSPNSTVRQAIESMQSAKVGDVLICEAGKLVGIFTERDALRLMAKAVSDCWDAPVGDYMVKSPVTIRTKDTLVTAVQRMVKGGYRRLIVLDDQGQPLGTITVAGVVHFLTELFSRTVYNLPPNPDPVMQEREGA